MDKIIYLCIKEPFFTCSSINFEKRSISSLSVDKTVLLTQFSSFQAQFWGFWHFLPSLKCNRFFKILLLLSSYFCKNNKYFQWWWSVPNILNMYTIKMVLLQNRKDDCCHFLCWFCGQVLSILEVKTRLPYSWVRFSRQKFSVSFLQLVNSQTSQLTSKLLHHHLVCHG